MTVCEDILAKLMVEPITKIIGKPGQGHITILESELAAKAAKIKTTDDMMEKGRKYCFLVIVLGKTKCATVWQSREHHQKTSVATKNLSNPRIYPLT